MRAYAKFGAGMAFGATALVSVGGANAADTPTASQEDRLEEIIVTGSLISDPNRESPSPIVISTIEELQQDLDAWLDSQRQIPPSFVK